MNRSFGGAARLLPHHTTSERARAHRTARSHARVRARRTLVRTIRQIPAYLRLLVGLLADSRVSIFDKLLVAGAIAYVVSPIDLIPDFIPFLGQVDDVYFLMVALQRLISRAGFPVIADHWSGDIDDLSTSSLRHVLQAASLFLPRRMRRRLRRAVR